MLTFMEWHYYRDFLFKNFCLLVLFLVSFVLSLDLLVDKYFIIFSFILKTSASFLHLVKNTTEIHSLSNADNSWLWGVQPQSLTVPHLSIKGSGNILEDVPEEEECSRRRRCYSRKTVRVKGPGYLMQDSVLYCWDGAVFPNANNLAIYRRQEPWWH